MVSTLICLCVCAHAACVSIGDRCTHLVALAFILVLSPSLSKHIRIVLFPNDSPNESFDSPAGSDGESDHQSYATCYISQVLSG
jgi:hypothetical protein